MSRQEQGFAMEGGFVMVIYYIYSALNTKYYTWNMIFYSISNMKDLLAAAFPLMFYFLNTISLSHIKSFMAYP